MSKTDLSKLFDSMKKQYGETSIYRLAEMPKYDVVSTSSLALDHALGIGGLPLGRVVGVYGPWGAGKTTLALQIANEYLKTYQDRGVLILDVEQKLETDWAASFIDDMDRVIVAKPEHLQEATRMLRDFASSGAISFVVLDSIGGAPTAASLDKDPEKASFGGNSMAMGDFARYSATLASKYKLTVLGLNQIRDDLDNKYVPKQPGGRAWPHACSIILYVQQAPKKGGENEAFETINGEEVRVGYKVKAKVVKSSVGIPGRIAEYWFYNVPNSLGFGIDHIEEVTNLSIVTGVVEKAGAWLKHPLFPGGVIQGQTKLRKFLADNKEIMASIYKETSDKMKSGLVDEQLAEFIPTENPDEMGSLAEESRVKTIQQIRASVDG